MTREGMSDQTLRALAYELKHPLVLIARQAELAATPNDIAQIQRTAEQSLRLIDSFLLSAQTEYGQQQLAMEPTTIGSILYDASSELRSELLRNSYELTIDDRVHDPVMTHRPALTSLVALFANTVMSFSDDSPAKKQLVLRGFKTKHGTLGIGVFSEHAMNENDIKQALELAGEAHMPLARLSHASHVSLAIADSLCSAIGGVMSVKRMGKLTGLVTELPRSEQLAFV